MSRRGGTRPGRCTVAAVVLSGLLAGCAYEDASDPPPPAALEYSGRPAPSVPAKGADILGREARNYAELKERLTVAAGSVLLDESGPADGPGVGFSKTATVKAAGSYTVTAACTGIKEVHISISQDPGTAVGLPPLVLDCSGVLSQVVELQPGYVGVQLTRQDPTGPWTGAVAGIRITAE